MKKSVEKKMMEFDGFFNNMKIDVDLDLKDCINLNPEKMTLHHIRQCFINSEKFLNNTFQQVHGALFFLFVMGYISEDEYFPKDLELTAYFNDKKIEYDEVCNSIINQRLALIDEETESAAC